MSEAYDFIVVGAGISGSAAAYQLARQGHKVVVIDRFAPAAMASGWTLAGVRQSGRHPAELPLARAAVELWTTLEEELGAPTHYTRKGNLRLARNEEEYEHIRRMVEEQSADGLDLSFLPDNATLRAMAPALSPAILGASFCPTDGHADPHATVGAFVAAAERAGASFRNHERVTAILVEGGRVMGVATDKDNYSAPRVILAAGLFGCELLGPLGLDVPIDVRMVTVIRSVPVERVLDQVIGVAAGNWAGRQEVNGRFRVTSGGQAWHKRMDINGGERSPRPAVHPPMATLGEVVAEMERLLPGTTAHAVEEVWAGLIDMTPDALPVLDTAPAIEGLVIAMGFSGHGFCLGPITGQILAALALGDETGFDLSAFAATRFNSRPDLPQEAMTLHG
ncbi:FAD-binding oxidoreductase [Mesorhizobium sp.]|uniref:NAD(P)/FAD-dependent oxidoreductase n=1 Tax=Mesorhizobium sp. TaxID=1871066 RepID=UPI000FE9EFA2|nr:FAD-binding oxidoreductase [Mesorhizobium sp.]RWM24665.1 MAG: FAD-binding oxidoreductase [Mesorhizobium sp.]TJV53494.1 MAG: FAD-binding oxidoreductase [Mesorhizobium sp.]